MNAMEERSLQEVVKPSVIGHDGLLKPWYRGVHNRVLPLVYDDALSYYEAIQKVYLVVNQALQYLYDLEDEIVTDNHEYTDNEIKKLKALLQAEIEQGDQELHDLYDSIVISMGELTVKFNQLYAAFQKHTELVDAKLHLQFENIKAYVDSLLVDRQIYVINPVTGVMSTIQQALNDMWSHCNVGALTAEEYDRMQITAGDYDNLGITAARYDRYARWIPEFFKRLFLMMLSPFTGEMEPYDQVIYSLARLHQVSITAEEYDALQLTAEAYDAKNITAKDYDWEGRILLTQN